MAGEGRPSSGEEVDRTITGYTQNAEQSENTIWKRIKESK